MISAFLDHLETSRGNSVATRNIRLAVIHSLFRYAALSRIDQGALIQRVLGIPFKLSDRADLCYLTADEIAALLAAPSPGTWHGRRDHALLALGCQAGLRVSELTGLAVADIRLSAGPHVRCHGKGRKNRAVPLTGHTRQSMKAWLAERAGRDPDPAFPGRTGNPLSRNAVERLVAKHAKAAAAACPSMVGKHVTPHTLRHSAAMALISAGTDISVIALWMGHFSGVPDPCRSARRNRSAGPRQELFCLPCTTANCEPAWSAPLPSLPIFLAHSCAPRTRPGQRSRRTVLTPEKAMNHSTAP